jgi:hypothetical protein
VISPCVCVVCVAYVCVVCSFFCPCLSVFVRLAPHIVPFLSPRLLWCRIEGYVFTDSSVSASDSGLTASLHGKQYAVQPLKAVWSGAQVDNWMGTGNPPDATYTFPIADGFVLTDGSTPGTLPLRAYYKKYSASHTDWAAVASSGELFPPLFCFVFVIWACAEVVRE